MPMPTWPWYVAPFRTFPVLSSNLVWDPGSMTWVSMQQPTISGQTINVNVSGPLAVTGPLTNAQLRAAAVPVDPSGVISPVSVASLPLPAGAALDASLATLHTDLSTGPVPVVGVTPTGIVPPSNTPVLVGGLRGDGKAQNWSINGSGMGSVSIDNVPTVAAVLNAGSAQIGHVIVDTAPSTPVTNASLDGTTLATIDTDIKQISTDLKSNIVLAAGSHVIGHVIVDSGTITTSLTNDGTFAKETGGNLATLAGTVSASKVAVSNASLDGTTLASVLAELVLILTQLQTTLPVSAAALPLPAGAAIETGGNLALAAANEYNQPVVNLLLREMRLFRQAFQDWSGANPRFDSADDFSVPRWSS